MSRLTLYSLLLNAFLIMFFIGKRIYFYFSSAPTQQERSYANLLNDGRTLTFNALPLDTTDIVFIGDSHTEKFPLEEMYADSRIKNRGIGLNTTSHIMGRISPIIASHPSQIFLQMGLNDLAEFISVDSVMTNYRIVVDMIRKGSPKTGIYVQSMLPVTSAGSDAKFESKIEELNRQLKSYCTKQRITFIDIFPHLYNGDGLDPKLSWDGTHLSLAGYKIWKRELDGVIMPPAHVANL